MCCKNLCDDLAAPANCFDNSIVCAENGRKFSIQLPKNSSETFCRVNVDGCVIPEDSTLERCDFMFRRCQNREIYFVELKGKDVEKGYSQIKSTIEFIRPKLKFQPEKVSAFIIVSRSPLSSTRLQALRNEFVKKKYGHVLEVKAREYVHKIESKNP